MSDTLHKLAERWKVITTVCISVIGSIWLVVTWADDKIRKVERVPAIEEAVLQLKTNEELATERIKRLEERVDRSEEKQDRANALILDRLDRLIEKGGG